MKHATKAPWKIHKDCWTCLNLVPLSDQYSFIQGRSQWSWNHLHGRSGPSWDLVCGLCGSVGTKYRLLEWASLSRGLANESRASIWKLNFCLHLRVGFDDQEEKKRTFLYSMAKGMLPISCLTCFKLSKPIAFLFSYVPLYPVFSAHSHLPPLKKEHLSVSKL